MAKVGRPPKAKAMDDLPEIKLREIDEALRSHADESVVSIYRRFGLATEGIGQDTFYKYARHVRRRAALVRQTEAGDDDSAADVPSMDAVRDRLLVEIMKSCKAGGMKPIELAALYQRVQMYDRIEIVRNAQRRADEKHAAWRVEHERKQAAALEAMQGEAPGLTPELLAQIKSRVLGI